MTAYTEQLGRLRQLRQTDRFMRDAYTGRGGFCDGSYLWAFPKESDERFRSRLDGAVYLNYVAKIVNIYSGFLWAKEPQREGSTLLDAFWANADGEGKTINQFLMQAQLLASLVGTVYLLVDKPSGQASSRATEGQPYIVLRKKEDLILHRKKAGRFSLVCFKEENEETEGDLYRWFDERGWKLTSDPEGINIVADENGKLQQGAYPAGMDRPPVVALHSTIPLDPDDHCAEPWAYQIAQQTWELYNLISELRQLLRANTFAMPIFPARDQAERERLSGLSVGPDKMLTFDPEGGGVPGYMAPPPDPVTLYEQRIMNTVQVIYQLANLEFVTGKADQSGVATNFYFQQANRTLAMMSQLDEQADQQIAKFVAAWMGQAFDGSIAHNRDFALSDLANELNIALEALSAQISPTFEREVKKRTARRVLGHGVPTETMAAIDQEIEQEADPYQNRLAQQAGGV